MKSRIILTLSLLTVTLIYPLTHSDLGQKVPKDQLAGKSIIGRLFDGQSYQPGEFIAVKDAHGTMTYDVVRAVHGNQVELGFSNQTVDSSKVNKLKETHIDKRYGHHTQQSQQHLLPGQKPFAGSESGVKREKLAKSQARKKAANKQVNKSGRSAKYTKAHAQEKREQEKKKAGSSRQHATQSKKTAAKKNSRKK